MKRMSNFIGRFWRNEEGNSTVEWSLIMPLFMVIFLSAFETGYLMVRHMMLERGLDMTVREIRLTTAMQFDADEIRRMVCDGTGIIPECLTSVRIEMQEVVPGQDVTIAEKAQCVDRSQKAQPAETIYYGQEHSLMVLRVCALFDPWWPGTGLGKHVANVGDEYALVAVSAFVMEPL